MAPGRNYRKMPPGGAGSRSPYVEAGPDAVPLTQRSRAGRSAGVPGPLDFPVVGHGAAFFDLDKTVIAKSSALAFGRPFFRDGLITRRDVFKAAYAQLVYKIGGADEQQMARIRDYIAK